MKQRVFVFVAFAVCLFGATLAAAQEFQRDQSPDLQCLADDANFTAFFDALALGFAVFGFLVLPTAIPLFPGVANKWKWADPVGRWWRFSLVASVVFLVIIFLPPQLARVGPLFRPSGLALFHGVGNIRLEYLDCDLQRIPKDYGFFFIFHWSPGLDLMIRYWWAQLGVFAAYAAISSGVYFAVVALFPRRRLEALAK